MGSGVGDGAAVCGADSVCDFHPNPGSLHAFYDEAGQGTWRICASDSTFSAISTWSP